MNAALGARGVADFAALTALFPAAFFAAGALDAFFAVADFAAGLLLAAVFLAAGLVAADFLAVAIFKPPHYRIGKLRHVTRH
jgi:hypothetical protein